MLEKILVFALFFAFSLCAQDIIEEDSIPDSGASAQRVDEEYTKPQIQEKLAGYTRMYTSGRGCLGGGIALTISSVIAFAVGIPLLSNADQSGIPFCVVGELGAGFGIPLLAAGAVLTKIGREKKDEYQKRLQRVSVVIMPNGVAVKWLL
jgi:hypothetical protein